MAEFTCCECSRRIISFGYGSDKPPEPRLCAACLMMPGWMDEPLLRERLGPLGHVGDGVMMTRQRMITCQKCGMTSCNANDIERRYCGHCKRFHDDRSP